MDSKWRLRKNNNAAAISLRSPKLRIIRVLTTEPMLLLTTICSQRYVLAGQSRLEKEPTRYLKQGCKIKNQGEPNTKESWGERKELRIAERARRKVPQCDNTTLQVLRRMFGRCSSQR